MIGDAASMMSARLFTRRMFVRSLLIAAMSAVSTLLMMTTSASRRFVSPG